MSEPTPRRFRPCRCLGRSVPVVEYLPSEDNKGERDKVEHSVQITHEINEELVDVNAIKYKKCPKCPSETTSYNIWLKDQQKTIYACKRCRWNSGFCNTFTPENVSSKIINEQIFWCSCGIEPRLVLNIEPETIKATLYRVNVARVKTVAKVPCSLDFGIARDFTTDYPHIPAASLGHKEAAIKMPKNEDD